jgi:phenylacetate-CoA ligase
VVTRVGEQDGLTLLAEHSDGSLKDHLSARFSELTKLQGDVEIVPRGSLPNDGKIIDDHRAQS